VGVVSKKRQRPTLNRVPSPDQRLLNAVEDRDISQGERLHAFTQIPKRPRDGEQPTTVECDPVTTVLAALRPKPLEFAMSVGTALCNHPHDGGGQQGTKLPDGWFGCDMDRRGFKHTPRLRYLLFVDQLAGRRQVRCGLVECPLGSQALYPGTPAELMRGRRRFELGWSYTADQRTRRSTLDDRSFGGNRESPKNSTPGLPRGQICQRSSGQTRWSFGGGVIESPESGQTQSGNRSPSLSTT
jgi:hypothetical protein